MSGYAGIPSPMPSGYSQMQRLTPQEIMRQFAALQPKRPVAAPVAPQAMSPQSRGGMVAGMIAPLLAQALSGQSESNSYIPNLSRTLPALRPEHIQSLIQHKAMQDRAEQEKREMGLRQMMAMQTMQANQQRNALESLRFQREMQAPTSQEEAQMRLFASLLGSDYANQNAVDRETARFQNQQKLLEAKSQSPEGKAALENLQARTKASLAQAARAGRATGRSGGTGTGTGTGALSWSDVTLTPDRLNMSPGQRSAWVQQEAAKRGLTMPEPSVLDRIKKAYTEFQDAATKRVKAETENKGAEGRAVGQQVENASAVARLSEPRAAEGLPLIEYLTPEQREAAQRFSDIALGLSPTSNKKTAPSKTRGKAKATAIGPDLYEITFMGP